MRRATCMVHCAWCISAVVLSASGCRNQQSEPSVPSANLSATTGGLRPVSLPDISSAAAPVQSQLRDRYAALKQKIDVSSTPAAELAEAYGGMGKLFIAAEYLDAAEPCFLNAQMLAPAEIRWPYYLGHLHRFRNEPEKAAALFEQTLHLQPDHVPSLVWLGEMQLARDRPEAAETPLTRAIELQPRNAAALYGLGRAALAREDYARAIKYLEDALALAPQASRIHYPLAMAYRGHGDRANAESHLRRRGDVDVPAADPLMAELGGLLQNAQAFEVRGSEALARREWATAITNLRQAIELAPNNAMTHLNLGTAMYLSGDGHGALAEFQEAVRLSPGLPKARYSIGVLMETNGQDREATEEFALAVKADPSFVEARLQLADALRRNERLEESMTHYAEILKTNPSVSQAAFGYAMALVRLHRYRPARDRLIDGMKSFPDQPGFAHALARLLAAAPDETVREGRRSLILMQDLLKRQKSPGLSETMAMTLAELGRYDEAVAWQRETIAAATQAGRADLAARLGENLRLYERGQPCRTPWRDDDPVFHPRPAK
jgi:tetratricopeptide (TPR) repeat protein